MASIFDQYQSTLTKEVPVAVPETSGSGYVSMPTKHSPIFKKQKLNLPLDNNILYTCVSSDWLLVLTEDLLIFRLNLRQPELQDHVKIDKEVQRCMVTGMHLDPLGTHCVLTLGPAKVQGGGVGGFLYLQKNSSKVKVMNRFKDCQITAIGWNWDNKNDSSTGWILLGNNKGQIFEADLSENGDKHSSLRPIFELGEGGDRKAITGIKFFRAPGTNNYIVIVTTFDRLYKFHETVKADTKMTVAQKIFTPYLNIHEDMREFHQIESKGNCSVLEYLYSVKTEFPKAFGWLTDAGVLYMSEIDITGKPQFVGAIELIPIPDSDEDLAQHCTKTETRRQYPKSVVLTDYHVLILFSDHLKAVSILNYQTVYEEHFTEQHGKLLELVKDPQSNSVYMYSTRGIYAYRINNEHRNVWRLYLEKNEFDLALSHCHENQAYKDIILTKKAESLFDKHKYMEAAKTFSDTQKSFEEVCLKFYELNENEALLCYLRNRLINLKPTDKTQITMLTIWIIELYLTEMSKHSPELRKFDELHKELDKLMKLDRVTDCIRNNRSVVQELIASHGDMYDLSVLKSVNQNVDSLITQFINQENFSEAINTLKTANKPELIYKYAPILMEELPSETNVMLKRLGKRLDAAKLIPSLTCIKSDKHIAEIIDYLEFAIHNLGNTDQSLNNCLILMYAKHRKNKLVSYLESQGKDKTLINYDIYFALRTAREHDVHDACVHLYCMLELWQKAVVLALKFDEKLAQQTASEVQDAKLRKQLWLLIAKHQIEAKNDVADALELLRECDLLRLEDILPFFSDFQKIDDFKETVCTALKEYEYKLQAQKRDMEESIESAEKVRNNLHSFRNRSIVISANELCTVCETHLMIKPFFLFPCGHKFHGDCMEREIIANDEEKQTRLNVLKYQLTSGSKESNTEKTREQIKEEIEELLASQCFYCGDAMIDALDQQFDTNWDDL